MNSQQKYYPWHTLIACLALRTLSLVSGCNNSPQPQGNLSQNATPANSVTLLPSVTQNLSSKKTSEIEQRIQFNLGRLKDRSYTRTYGHGYTWYTAAEELGSIGKPAVPHLIGKLQTKDQYELKLALYALLLSTQDIEVKKLTNGEYINLITALDETHNAQNKKIALRWWEKYKRHFIQKSG